jgi:hypothetical protein
LHRFQLLSLEHAGTRLVNPAHRLESRGDLEQRLHSSRILSLMLVALPHSRQSAHNNQEARRAHGSKAFCFPPANRTQKKKCVGRRRQTSLDICYTFLPSTQESSRTRPERAEIAMQDRFPVDGGCCSVTCTRHPHSLPVALRGHEFRSLLGPCLESGRPLLPPVGHHPRVTRVTHCSL